LLIDLLRVAPQIAAMTTELFAFFIPQPGFLGLGGVVIVAGLALDALLGDFPWLFRRVAHPVVWIGNLIGWLEKRLNRPDRSNSDRLFRGVLTSLAVILCAGLGGGIIQLLAAGGDYGLALEAIILAILIAQKGLYQHVVAVANALEQDGIGAGRYAVSMIVGRNPDTLDIAGVSRAAIESCAENFSDGVVAPLFWFVVGGPIGLCVYKAINTLDSMIGHRNVRYLYFGRFAARLDDVVNFLPARLAGGLICLAALVARGPHAAAKAVRVMMRDARKHKSPNAGWQEAAMAGALDLSLAGPRQYGSETVADPYIGNGRRDAGPADIRSTLHLFALACVLNGLWAVVVWLAVASGI
jgi:adenosylcobinamide-phosphate synthase